MAAKIFIQKDGETFGPMSSTDLMTLAQSGKLAPADLVWKEGRKREEGTRKPSQRTNV